MRSLIAAGALALGIIAHTPQAWAQTNVTLFGTVDVGLAWMSDTHKDARGVSHSGANISRFGFRGTEDLGGGLSAGFWLEAGFAPDTGALSGSSFNRRATVSLMGQWGEIRLGRDDSATFLSTLLFDPFMTNGVGATNAFVMNGAPIQISNAVSYFLPRDLGGVYGQLQFAPGEDSPDGAASSSQYKGLRLGLRRWGANVVVSAARIDAPTAEQDVRIRNAAASYDIRGIQPMLLWASEKRAGVEIRALQLGVKAPLGPGELLASVGRYDTVRSGADWWKLSIGYGYDLSKRTRIYATYARLDNASAASRGIVVLGLPAPVMTAGSHSNGYQIGLRHFF